MIKNFVRSTLQKAGYEFVKTSTFNYGKKYQRKSTDSRFDLYETPNGGYFLPKKCNGDLVANAIKTGKLFDEAIFAVAKDYIKPDSVILDLGSNYGQMAIELSKLANNTTVYAFEAQKMVFDVLQKNIQLNHRTNIKAFYNAVYDKDGIEFHFPTPDLSRFTSFGSYGLDLKARSGVPVKSLTIDSLNFELPVSFMKIDIQGSDLAAMKGSVNTIRRYQMPIIFEYEEQFQGEFDTSLQDYVEFVDSIGYKFLKTIQDINYLIVPR